MPNKKLRSSKVNNKDPANAENQKNESKAVAADSLAALLVQQQQQQVSSDSAPRVEAELKNLNVEGTEDTTVTRTESTITITSPMGEVNNMSKARLLQVVSNALQGMSRPTQKPHTFWSTQPVPKIDEEITQSECIESDKEIFDIQPNPYTLPPGFIWLTLDLNNGSELMELYTLLTENYVEDEDANFRFDYQPEFLKWSLQPPGWKRDWHVGVRVEKSGRLVGFISAIPTKLSIYGKQIKMVDINFLCVHKKLRSKRLAPVLIREITRRVNLTGVFQAAYTAGVVLPKPVSICRYWHRPLNPKKLIDIKFIYLARNMTIQRTIKLYKLPDQLKTPGFRRIQPKDMDQAHKLMNEYLKKYSLYPIFTKEDFRHWFTPKEDVIECFIVEDDKGNVTDLTSFYCLPSSVMHHPVHKSFRCAYSFYNVSTKTPLPQLINDTLVSARGMQMDVFNALNQMENNKFLMPLKFNAGDGDLQYYLYNWRCPFIKAENMALILM